MMENQEMKAVNTGGQQFIDDDIVKQITDGINSMTEVIAKYVHTLTDAQRKHLLRAGLKNLGFAEEALKEAKLHPELVPGYIGMDKFVKDARDYENRRLVCVILRAVLLSMEDGLLVAGDVFYRDALGFYEYVKDAAIRGNTAVEVVHKILKPRFENHGRKEE